MEDTSTNYSTIVISVLMAVVIIATVMMPIITATTQITATTEISNEGAEWLKLGYNEGDDYSFIVGFNGENNFTVGTQIGEYEDLICYADPDRTLFVSGDNWYLLTTGQIPSLHKFTDTASVSNTSGTLTINDGSTVIYSGESPTWAYAPDANGVYGFFTQGGLNLEEGKPKVAVGEFAETFAYADTIIAPFNYDLGLEEMGDYGEGEVVWGNEYSSIEVMNAGNNTLLGAGSDTWTEGIFTCSTVRYGTGYCGIEYIDVSNITNEIVIPTTISHDGMTYIVKGVGIPNGTTPIIDDSLLTQNVTLNLNSIQTGSTVTIGAHAFDGCTHITFVSDWKKVSSVYSYGFANSGISGSLTFRNTSQLTLGPYAFANCDSITGVYKGSTGNIYCESHCFDGCSGIVTVDRIAGNYAFANCENLKTANVTSLGHNHIFDGCTSLERISYSSATTIGEGYAKGCVNLKSLYMQSTTPTNVFLIPTTVTTIGISAFEGCSSIDNILILPDTITTVGDNAFKGCDSIPNLIVCSSATFGENSLNMAGVKEVLDLGNNGLTTTSYGLNAEETRDSIPAMGYIAPTSIHETVIVEDTSLSATLLKILPVFMVLAVVIFIGYALLRPDSEFVQSLKRRF